MVRLLVRATQGEARTNAGLATKMNGTETLNTLHKQVSALGGLLNAIVNAVAVAGPDGCPGGTLYAALMTQGCTLARFEMLMSILVDAGRLRKDGQVYRVVEEPKK